MMKKTIMITQNQFEQLKKYGYVSSWTIWADPDTKPKSNIGDLSVFHDKDILCRLNSDYMFVGLNAAKHETDSSRLG